MPGARSFAGKLMEGKVEIFFRYRKKFGLLKPSALSNSSFETLKRIGIRQCYSVPL